jgi:hypothetical protein
MLLGGPQNTIKSHLVFTALFCFAPFSVFSSRMSAPHYLSTFHHIERSRINLFQSYLSHGFYDLNSVIVALLASPPFPRGAAVVDFYIYNCCSRVSN